MKDKKSIVLLIVASIIFCIALVFAVWSFTIDRTIANQKDMSINDNINNKIQTTNYVSESENEESKTEDFEVTYKDFTVQDEKGNEIKLSDYQNQPVVLLFINEENQDSVQMLNRINTEYENYKNDIVFIAISTKGMQKETLEHEVPIYQDINGEVTKLYGVTQFPTIIYIDKENKVFNAKTGLTTVDALKANLDILSEQF